MQIHLNWPRKFEPAQNILGPVEYRRTNLSNIAIEIGNNIFANAYIYLLD